VLSNGSKDSSRVNSPAIPPDELMPHQKNEFVNWNHLDPLLNRELYNEEAFFVYTDQSSSESDSSASEDSISD
jgi:hypothetical protein